MANALDKVVDAIDLETFFSCESEQEGRSLMLDLLNKMGFQDVDIVFAEYAGLGARIRGRAYIHRPADNYAWLND